jgi:uncharacterized protein YecE (DUF72 family)
MSVRFNPIGRKKLPPVRIGTSGWTYKDWRGPFYPDKLVQKNWLQWYSAQFDSAEINGSFYRTPSLEAVAAWRDQTPDDFLFAWKASKFITHWKRLSEKCDNSLELLEGRLQALSPKVGPILFQLPPHFQANLPRLTSFVRMLPARRKYAFEFRHSSWYEPPILELLREHDISLCISDHHDAPAPWEVTASFVFVRGHGPSGRYHGRYRKPTLQRWADTFLEWQQQQREVYCYFDNDQKSAAPLDALRLKDLLNRSG